MNKNKFFLCGLVLALSGCASEPFKAGRPVKTEGYFFARSYSQGGKPVSIFSVFDELKKHDATKEKASNGQMWYYGALGAAGLGGVFIGYNLVVDTDSRTLGFLAGAGLIGAGFAAAYYSDKNTSEALDTYNRRVGRHGSNSYSVRPILSLAQVKESSSRVGVSPVLGLALNF